MSAKRDLAQAVEALPESITIEEAFERLYQAFKLKRAQTHPEPPIPMPDFMARLREYWKGPPMSAEASQGLLDELRGNR